MADFMIISTVLSQIRAPFQHMVRALQREPHSQAN